MDSPEPLVILLLLSLLLLLVAGKRTYFVQTKYDWIEKECPDVDTKMMVDQVPWGVEGRAYLTVPKGLRIAPSKIKGAGFGVLSDTFIPKYTWLGEYEGELVPKHHSSNISWYAWQIRRGERIIGFTDAYQIDLSSYHRYVNAPMRHIDENVIGVDCHGRKYYITSKDIAPGDELLVSYGPAYAKKLKINLNEYYKTAAALVAAGFDLNKMDHRILVRKVGCKLYQMRHPPSSCLSQLLKTMKQKS